MYEIRNSFDVAPRIRYPLQTKSFALTGLADDSFLHHLIQHHHHDLTAHMALQFFKTTSPLFNAVDIITEEIAAIEPIIWDMIDEVPIRESKVLDILKTPNPQMSGPEFLQEMASYFLITGNNIIVGTGGVTRPPLELGNISTARITADGNKADGFVQRYTVNVTGGQALFNRIEEKRKFRFIHRDDQELWHSKTFNPNQHNNHFFGLSKLMPIFSELEQYNESSIHNLALLRNGAAVKGILSTEKNLTEEQYDRLQQQLDNHYKGSANAGNPMITEGGAQMGQYDRDVARYGFLELKERCEG